ncbi:MAG TPA: hypothetical protein DCQ06_05770 [Myxococcales bacterium]|nr:hypothetical protein [Myxococcales bacterium]HAN31088.1 hypothetical protein [Myxococcales bacterium]
MPDFAREVRELQVALSDEFPAFRVAYKQDSLLHRIIGVLLRPFNSRYLSHYTTVLGATVWFPSRSWTEQVGDRKIYEILRHEAVHMRDARRFPLVFQISYLLLPLPVVFTARAWWELRAYSESLRVAFELDGYISQAQVDEIVERFVGADYLYMCPFPSLVQRLLCAQLPAPPRAHQPYHS